MWACQYTTPFVLQIYHSGTTRDKYQKGMPQPAQQLQCRCSQDSFIVLRWWAVLPACYCYFSPAVCTDVCDCLCVFLLQHTHLVCLPVEFTSSTNMISRASIEHALIALWNGQGEIAWEVGMKVLYLRSYGINYEVSGDILLFVTYYYSSWYELWGSLIFECVQVDSEYIINTSLLGNLMRQ